MLELYHLLFLLLELIVIDFLLSFVFSNPYWTALFFFILLTTFVQFFRVFSKLSFFKRSPSIRISILYVAILGSSFYWLYENKSPYKEEAYLSQTGYCLNVFQGLESAALKNWAGSPFVNSLQDLCRFQKLNRLFLRDPRLPPFCEKYSKNSKIACYEAFVLNNAKSFPVKTEIGLSLVKEALIEIEASDPMNKLPKESFASLLKKLSPVPAMGAKFEKIIEKITKGEELSAEEMAALSSLDYEREVFRPFLRDAKSFFGLSP